MRRGRVGPGGRTGRVIDREAENSLDGPGSLWITRRGAPYQKRRPSHHQVQFGTKDVAGGHFRLAGSFESAG